MPTIAAADRNFQSFEEIMCFAFGTWQQERCMALHLFVEIARDHRWWWCLRRDASRHHHRIPYSAGTHYRQHAETHKRNLCTKQCFSRCSRFGIGIIFYVFWIRRNEILAIGFITFADFRWQTVANAGNVRLYMEKWKKETDKYSGGTKHYVTTVTWPHSHTIDNWSANQPIRTI